MKLHLFSSMLLALPVTGLAASSILVEAEGFDNYGGWSLDTQFMDEMGSPYLLAHGTGTPVGDASTVVECSEAGEFRVWVSQRGLNRQHRLQTKPGT